MEGVTSPPLSMKRLNSTNISKTAEVNGKNVLRVWLNCLSALSINIGFPDGFHCRVSKLICLAVCSALAHSRLASPFLCISHKTVNTILNIVLSLFYSADWDSPNITVSLPCKLGLSRFMAAAKTSVLSCVLLGGRQVTGSYPLQKPRVVQVLFKREGIF